MIQEDDFLEIGPLENVDQAEEEDEAEEVEDEELGGEEGIELQGDGGDFMTSRLTEGHGEGRKRRRRSLTTRTEEETARSRMEGGGRKKRRKRREGEGGGGERGGGGGRRRSRFRSFPSSPNDPAWSARGGDERSVGRGRSRISPVDPSQQQYQQLQHHQQQQLPRRRGDGVPPSSLSEQYDGRESRNGRWEQVSRGRQSSNGSRRGRISDGGSSGRRSMHGRNGLTECSVYSSFYPIYFFHF